MKKALLFFILPALITTLFPFTSKAQFSQIQWDSLSSGMGITKPYVRALAVWDSASSFPGYPLYAGGDFTTSSQNGANHIAMFNFSDNKWHAMKSGTNGSVCALAQLNSKKLYVGGKFDSAGGISAMHIASWDSTNFWDSLKGGVNGPVYALAVLNNILYVGGNFTMAGGVPANRIAAWDGTNWSAVGAGFDTTVFALCANNDTLYAGGLFTKSNGKQANHIAEWDGTKWDSLGTGLNNTVYSLASCTGGKFSPYALFAGGAFTKAGGINANYIASWDYYISGWDSVGSGTNDTVFALNAGEVVIASRPSHRVESGGNALLVGGNFTRVGKLHSPFIVAYMMGEWDSIGFINGPVYALANPLNSYPYNNYAGGAFDSSFFPYSIPVNYVAQLGLMIGGGINEVKINSAISVYPNPGNGTFTIEIANGHQLIANSLIEVYNVLGEEVYSKQWTINNGQCTINLNNQPSGIYMCRVIAETGETIGSCKLVIEK